MPASQDDRAPNPVDIHVGNNIRMLRRERNLSQAGLASALGLTFQQVQKYERGANRVSASKIFEIAQALKAPVATLFAGLEPAGAGAPDTLAPLEVQRFLGTYEGAELARLFLHVRSPGLRRKVLELLREIIAADA